jgi:predicted acetyltransferase
VPLRIRPATREELRAFSDAMSLGFGWDTRDHLLASMAEYIELERTRCAFDGPDMVATLGSYTLDLTVPGGTLPTGGTTFVTVRATHRRRGILRALMREHLADCRERGEPLAALWASESGIYGRFGYGLAAWMNSLRIERAHAAFAAAPEASGRMRIVGPEEAATVLPAVYDRVRLERPGCFARPPAWWEHRRLFDPPEFRGGASGYRYAVYEEDGAPRGYLQYRVRVADSDGLPQHTLRIVELQALDTAGRAALWRYACEVDLVAAIEAWNQPIDEPAIWWFADPRRLQQSPHDSLWLRVLDVSAALSGRAYRADGALVLEVRDRFLPERGGVFALEAQGGKGECVPSRARPELSLPAEALGALVLGGNRPSDLWRAGLLEGTAEAVRRADALLGWDPAPWCPEIF